jgi:hypothetical protein
VKPHPHFEEQQYQNRSKTTSPLPPPPAPSHATQPPPTRRRTRADDERRAGVWSREVRIKRVLVEVQVRHLVPGRAVRACVSRQQAGPQPRGGEGDRAREDVGEDHDAAVAGRVQRDEQGREQGNRAAGHEQRGGGEGAAAPEPVEGPCRDARAVEEGGPRLAGGGRRQVGEDQGEDVGVGAKVPPAGCVGGVGGAGGGGVLSTDACGDFAGQREVASVRLRRMW